MSDRDLDDRLSQIFVAQEVLNDHVFETNSVRDNAGDTLRMGTIRAAAMDGKLAVNELPNEWLKNYATAMADELRELQNDLRWKWWSKDQIDLQNIRVELIDLLHFLVSAMICAGLDARQVHEVYLQKHAVNMARQNSGYSRANKSEDDNRSIR